METVIARVSFRKWTRGTLRNEKNWGGAKGLCTAVHSLGGCGGMSPPPPKKKQIRRCPMCSTVFSIRIYNEQLDDSFNDSRILSADPTVSDPPLVKYKISWTLTWRSHFCSRVWSLARSTSRSASSDTLNIWRTAHAMTCPTPSSGSAPWWAPYILRKWMASSLLKPVLVSWDVYIDSSPYRTTGSHSYSLPKELILNGIRYRYTVAWSGYAGVRNFLCEFGGIMSGVWVLKFETG